MGGIRLETTRYERIKADVKMIVGNRAEMVHL